MARKLYRSGKNAGRPCPQPWRLQWAHFHVSRLCIGEYDVLLSKIEYQDLEAEMWQCVILLEVAEKLVEGVADPEPFPGRIKEKAAGIKLQRGSLIRSK